MEGFKVGNAQLMKDINLWGIFKAIYKEGSISRRDLAKITGYSPATITNHVRTLMDDGFVIETKKGTSTGGRRPINLTIDPHRGYFFTVDIKVNQVLLSLFNLTIKLVIKRIIPINKGEKPDTIFNRIFHQVDHILEENQLPLHRIMGFGVAVPGLVHKEKGLLEFAPNLGWSQEPISSRFIQQYGITTILENEATASVIGESQFVYPQIDTMVFVSVNEGIGCGILFSHKVYRGATGNAGEFGHIIIDRDGPPCHCGNNGCWETLASENFILSKAKERGLLGVNGTKGDIYHRAKENQQLQCLFQETGRNLGIGMVNIVNGLSPHLLVVGGDILKIKDYIQDDMMAILKEKALPGLLSKTKLRFSNLDNLAPLFGLASLLLERSIDFSH